MKYKIFTDGASSGNPGPSGYGFVIYDEEDNVIVEKSIYIGNTTNNVAEYNGLLNALESVKTLNPESVEIFLDSELIVKQIKGEYKVKSPHLKNIYQQVIDLLKEIEYKIKHVPRELNKYADKLAKKAVEENK